MNNECVIKIRKEFIKPKKDYSELLKSKYVAKWINGYKESEQQKKLGILKKYIKFTEKDADLLILEHYEDIKRDDPINITGIGKRQILEFYDYMVGNKINGKTIKKPITENSARQYAFSVITSFFAKNRIPIRFDKNEIPKEQKGVKDKVWRNGKERIDKDNKKICLKQIRDSLSLLRDKAILHCKISSGMDDIDLFNLRIKDFEEGYYPEYNISYLEGNRIKSKVRYQTFFGGEACNFIKLYIMDRKAKGESINSDSWLFISNYYNPDGTTKKIKANAFSKNLKETCQKLEVKNVTPKALRRYFNTIVIRTLHDDKEIVERMMGHVGNISAKYQQLFNDIDDFVKFYFEQIDPIISLESNSKIIINAQKEISTLQTRSIEQDEQIQILLREKIELENRMEEIEQFNNETAQRAEKLESDIKEIKNTLKKLVDDLSNE